MNLRYIVRTDVFAEGRIEQCVEMCHERAHESVREVVLRQVLDTGEAQVRAALIKLGWTPPVELSPEPFGWYDSFNDVFYRSKADAVAAAAGGNGVTPLYVTRVPR